LSAQPSDLTASFCCSPKFGKVFTLTKGSFIDAIDREKAGVTVIVHIYEDVSQIQKCKCLQNDLIV